VLYRLVYALIIPPLKALFRIRITGREHVPEGALLLCGNHTALLDPLFMAMATGARRPLNFLAKEELFRVPVLKTVIRKLGAFPVARGQADIGAVRQSVDLLKNGGRLMIFPDGTRVKHRGESPLQLGAAMISTRANAPVLPVFMSYPKRMFRRTAIIIGPPFMPGSKEGSGSGEFYRALTARIDEAVWGLGEGKTPVPEGTPSLAKEGRG